MRIDRVVHNGQGFSMMTPGELEAAGVPTAVWLAAHLKNYAAHKRWQIEIAGTVVNGTPVPTDDRAKTLLIGAAAWLAAADTTTVIVSGVAQTMTGTQVKAMRDAICDHVDRCFTAQGEVYAAIDAGTITTTAAIDAFAWPSNG